MINLINPQKYVNAEINEVLEDITAEIQAIDVTMGTSDYPFIPREKVFEIIDKHIGKEKE